MRQFHLRRRSFVLSAFAAAAFSATCFAQNTSIVLQNGLNGYRGFQDTYLEYATAPLARGGDTLLQSWCG